MRLLRRIYSIYGTIVFFGTFLLLLPIFILTIEVSVWNKYGRRLNRIWSNVFFGCLLIRVKFENLEYLKANRQYVIVSNHFSYLDIPVLGLIPFDLVFVGKASLGNIPLFGYMFRNLHIAVDRNSLKSRGASIAKAKEVIEQGASVVVFPEGGINSPNPPRLARFKDGAFRIAMDKQIPLIPITLSYNHLILPDDGRFLLRYKKAKVVIHPPVPVEGSDPKMVNSLKEHCFGVIQKQLLRDNPGADTSMDTRQ
jgi:1-acyl-sn-glycerol-3-phosphate acyltransferase